ncbi:hypothetical protein Isop_0850 [Isosphaera pallida ATCC 43644]|uniref:Uncharacterized protein n=1 Tax=Isosphaera pallida (strain ATCC 43644 / DSM 9630 / IS1B) TaxID=575540 RepID=E8R2F5_ISOPI|nr:hypothetical protein [Isosphaera pallida]ADV61440.1 hypothetical protein Isop_0850 [Isosphaera pallida ATCC 43644]
MESKRRRVVQGGSGFWSVGECRDESDVSPAVPPAPAVVPIRLADLFPALTRASQDGFQWLRDFEDDHLMVSEDLFEVLRAFQAVELPAG